MPRAGEVPTWLDIVENAYAIHGITAVRPELQFFLIHLADDGTLTWNDLGDPRHPLRPFHFEIHFGKRHVRDRYYLDSLARARELRRVVVGDLYEFCDLFYALPDRDDWYLYSGQFSRRAPAWDWLADSWRAISGREPASADPDFAHFVRMALTVPVLEPPLIDAVSELMSIYGAFLTCQCGDDGGAALRERVSELASAAFSPLWPVRDLVDSALCSDKFLLPHWQYEGELRPWQKEGMGIERLPTTAMALMPLDPPDAPLDPLKTLLRNARLQTACVRLARDMRETAATPLQDYGVSIVTSCDESTVPARTRLELRERASRFQELIADQFGCASVVGIGRSLPAGGTLYESHRDALLALHMAMQLDQDVLFFDEHGESRRLRYAELERALSALEQALAGDNATALKLEADRYVQLILRFANERVEAARGQFLAALFRLLDSVLRRHPLSSEARDRFADELTGHLEEAQSLYQVIGFFNDALSRLALMSSRAWQGPAMMRMEAALQYMRENFMNPLSLPEVARRAGFSVASFSRVFKQTTGTSFLSYLREVRVEHAKRLLLATSMTAEEVAQESGFSSQHHLIRSFKKVEGDTPGAFREHHRAGS